MAETKKDLKDKENDIPATDEEKNDVKASTSQVNSKGSETPTSDKVNMDKSTSIQQVEELKDQISSLEDRYLRAEAEIKNIQTRNEKERAALLKYDGQQLAHDLLPVVDNIERALAAEVGDDEGGALKKGIELVLKHLNDALSQNGITEIAAEGAKFDPQLHQAVQTVPATDDLPADHVAQVLQKGYLLKDRVLRPAMVAVAQ